MGCFRFYLIRVIFICIMIDETFSARDVMRSHDAVTAPSQLEDFYVRIKRETPYTYVDDGELGQLRQEDYTGVVRYEAYRKLTRSASFNQRQPEDDDEDNDLEDKSLICSRIFNSTFFEMRGERAVRFGLKEKRTIDELLRSDPDLYADIYGGWPEERGEWLNPYQRLAVTLSNTDEKFLENVFRCVTRKGKFESYVYKGYFISAIYRSWNSENIMNGRFIFTFEGIEMRLLAIADEPATEDETVLGITHSAYYGARHERHPEPQANKNPVCTLSKDDKMRLCAAVLNSRAFKGKVKFFPREDNIEAECKKKKVVFSGHVQTMKKKNWFSVCISGQLTDKLVEMVYNEWMIGCRILPDENSSRPITTSVYYISPGRAPRTAIVFQPSTDDMYVPVTGLSWVRLIPDCGELKPIKIIS